MIPSNINSIAAWTQLFPENISSISGGTINICKLKDEFYVQIDHHDLGFMIMELKSILSMFISVDAGMLPLTRPFMSLCFNAHTMICAEQMVYPELFEMGDTSISTKYKRVQLKLHPEGRPLFSISDANIKETLPRMQKFIDPF
jgi:hypothetical protein